MTIYRCFADRFDVVLVGQFDGRIVGGNRQQSCASIP